MQNKQFIRLGITLLLFICIIGLKGSQQPTGIHASTIESRQIKGVLDQVTNDQALILIESLNREWLIDIDELPYGSKEGIWFTIETGEEVLKIISIDYETTREAESAAAYLMNNLQNKE